MLPHQNGLNFWPTFSFKRKVAVEIWLTEVYSRTICTEHTDEIVNLTAP